MAITPDAPTRVGANEDTRDWMGARLPRKEDARLITGQGRFVADMALPGMLHAVFVRSDVAHARIVSIDTTAAKALPGVLCVLTGPDIKGPLKSMRQPVVTPNIVANYHDWWPLALDTVKFHGEPVALVVANDKYVAVDAAELVTVDYDPLPVVTDPEAALQPGTTQIHDAFDTNEIMNMSLGGGYDAESQRRNAEEVDRIIRSADIVVSERFKVHRTGVTPMEPRACLCDWSDADGLVAWVTTQRPHTERMALAQVLDIPAERVRVIAPRDIGGGFGVKAPFYREIPMIAHAARLLRRPVRWVESRYESLMNVGHERGQINDLEVAATKEGKLLAFRSRIVTDNGTGEVGVYWGFAMVVLGGVVMPNAYTWERADINLRSVITNKPSLTPSRAFGNFPTRFALERAIDLVAKKCGIEPSQLRRQNLIRELPYTTVTGEGYDSGDFEKVWSTLMANVDLPAFRAEQAALRAQGRHIGIGLTCGVEISGLTSCVLVPLENLPGYGAASMRIDPLGKVQVFSGDAPSGQGHETAVAQVVAAAFGIDPADTTLISGDSTTTPFGAGSIAARFGSIYISAVQKACDALKDKIARVFAHDQKVAAGPGDFDFVNGEVVYRRDPSRRESFRKLVDRIIMMPLDLPEGVAAGLDASVFFEADKSMVSFNANCCIVEVDEATGKFEIKRWVTCEDVGNAINPMIVDGQMHGAIIQGLSNAMFEEFVFNEEGQQLTADFENYKMATAADVPDIELNYTCTPSPYTPLGSRGCAEGRPSSVSGALVNAVCDALSPFGVEINELPIRPNTVWRHTQAAKEAMKLHGA